MPAAKPLRLLTLLSCALFSLSCDRPVAPASSAPSSAPVAAGWWLDDLPSATGTEVYQPEEGEFVELVRKEDGWHVYLNGEEQTTGPNSHEAYQKLEEVYKKSGMTNQPVSILISANADTPWGVITSGIQGAAKSGTPFIHFLTSEDTGGSIRTLSVALPTASPTMREYEPKLIVISADGSLGIGSTNPPLAMASLAELGADLSMYHQAASTIALEPEAQIAADAATPYQRVMEVLSVCQRQGMKDISFTKPPKP